MITIYKYELPLSDYFKVRMPEGASVLHVGAQEGNVCLWAKVNTDAPLKNMVFGLAGTGQEIHPGVVLSPYLGTVQLHGGAFVFHLFGGCQERF